MALVWYVDKFPRSRKPVLYRRLEDFSLAASDNDLLPVLLPCALCCAQQQMSASLVAHQLQQRRKRPTPEQKVKQTNIDSATHSVNSSVKSTELSDFLQLCQHVECMIEKSMNQIKGQENDGEKVITENENDMRLRSLRDANRGYSIHQPQSSSNDNHYLWRKNQPEDKYKSRFLPMRNVDPVRDDLAVRRLLKHTLKPTVSKMPPTLNFAALSSNEEKARQNPIRISIFKTKRRNFAHCATKGRNIATSTASKS